MSTENDTETRGRGEAENFGSGTIRSFRGLRVWMKAMDLAVEVYEVTKSFPAEERFSLTDQVRRSSRSVAANLAEAWRKRRYPAAFVAKLNDSEAEVAETQTHLEMAQRIGLLAEDRFSQFDQGYEEVLAMLTRMASQPEKWVIRPKKS